ncbi:MAG: PAS domain S-box protein [Chloroflexota bacterium]|nr:MAG: PAS domain S-box protein [Chloroflexota bacterium]
MSKPRHVLITENRHARDASQMAYLRRLTEITSAAVFILQGMKIRYANSAASTVTGYEKTDLLGMEFWEFIHPSYQEIVRHRGVANHWSGQWAGEQSEQIPSRYELKIIHKLGHHRWVDITAGLIDFEGEPSWMVTAFDITERDLAEQALQRTRRDLETRIIERTSELQDALDQLARSNEQLRFELNERKRLEQILHKSERIIQTALEVN